MQAVRCVFALVRADTGVCPYGWAFYLQQRNNCPFIPFSPLYALYTLLFLVARIADKTLLTPRITDDIPSSHYQQIGTK